MNVDVVLHAGLLGSMDFKGKVVVVIDVLRATNVIIEGLTNGAKEFIPVETVKEALDYRAKDSKVLLGGERDGVLIGGFDLDNSPFSYTKDKVAGKTIVMTTTNGTQALRGVVSADKVFIASFRNIASVAQALLKYPELVIVCSGSEKRISLEDSLCAGALIYQLELYTSLFCSDIAIMLKSLYRSNAANLQNYLSAGEHYQFLAEMGLFEDLSFCLSLNKNTTVPVFDGTAVSK